MARRHTAYAAFRATRSGRAAAAAVLLALALAGAGPAAADQTDPRLDALFEVLQGDALSYTEAKGIEARIWRIWMEGDSGSANVLMRDGVQAMREQNLARAEEVFTALIELDPDFAEAWNKRATVRYHRGDYEGALSDVKKTLSLEPRHFGAMSGLGLIYDARDNLDGARKAYKRALELNPHQRSIARRLEQLEDEAEQNKI